MKLTIVDMGWGIDRRSGKYGENEVETVVFEDLKVGPLPPVGPAKHVFKIEEVEEGKIKIFLSERSGCINLAVGKSYDYRPFSMDGGHYYRLNLE